MIVVGNPYRTSINSWARNLIQNQGQYLINANVLGFQATPKQRPDKPVHTPKKSPEAYVAPKTAMEPSDLGLVKVKCLECRKCY